MAKRLKTASDVRRALAFVANEVLEGNITPGKANAFTYCCQSILNSIRQDEQDKKIQELEELYNELMQDK